MRVGAPALVGVAATLAVLAATGNLGDDGRTVVVREAVDLPTAADASAPPSAPLPGDAAADATGLTSLIERAAPSVTNIVADGERAGSGFLIDDRRHLLTNAHVVEDAKTVEVSFVDGSETTGHVLGTDESSDLAVVGVDEVPASVRPLPLGRSGPVHVGAGVVAIGNPLGLERTATTGIVSGIERVIVSPNAFAIQNAIQTDAAINQGNSGGPLLDLRGRVIGINSQIETESGLNRGIGFAVPIDTIRPIAESIIESGTAEHAWLGIQGETLTPAEARAHGAPGRGVGVTATDDRGPAQAAGIEGDEKDDEVGPDADVIVAVDGRAIADMADVSRAVSGRRVGERLTLTVVRDGRERQVTVRLADRPGDIGKVGQHP